MSEAGFHYEWVTIGNHRILLSCRTGFPNDRMRFIAHVAAETCDNNSSDARVVRVFFDDKSDTWTINVATTDPNDVELEDTITTVLQTMYGNGNCIPQVDVVKPGHQSSDSYNHTEHLSIEFGVAEECH